VIDHVDLVVRDLERSLAFYRGLLAPLGYTSANPIVGERGERVVYVSHPDGDAIGLRAAQSDLPFDRYALGVHHVALRAPSRSVVDERAEWLRGAGATIESGPAEYPYSPGYYAVFFYDPDGLKLEIVHLP
jgi:glyoxylase I family protein